MNTIFNESFALILNVTNNWLPSIHGYEIKVNWAWQALHDTMDAPIWDLSYKYQNMFNSMQRNTVFMCFRMKTR